MEYNYIENLYKKEDFILPLSERIDNFLLQSNQAEIFKAVEFLKTNEKILYIHGFLGTGKRQFINYISSFINKDVIKLEYYCKPSTVCDDILLSFIDVIDKTSLSKAVNHSVKVTTLSVKFQKYISSIKKPFIIILHSFDDILPNNSELIIECLMSVLKNENIKLIFSTRAMITDLFNGYKYDKKIFLKPFPKDIFREYLDVHKIKGTEDAYDDFYKYSRGYYYYTALTVKIIQAMQISLNDFLAKYVMSGFSFDFFLGYTYLNLLPNTIRNFFWFLRTVRHGISLNTLAILGLLDDVSIEYLKTNFMIYIVNEIIYVQDFFQQDIDISIPTKVEIKLHKYIIGIYEKELKEALQTRSILMSRQALRAEIEYHSQKILEIENADSVKKNADNADKTERNTDVAVQQSTPATEKNKFQIDKVRKLTASRQYTDAIELILKYIEQDNPSQNTLAELRVELGRLYKIINEYSKAQHYYELAIKYYKQQSQYINLNYIYYEITSLYFDMYKVERAIKTIKKVIYSVDTPSSLMIDACTLLGNIYSNINNVDDAIMYYKKALDSIDETTQGEGIAELYFKYALMCDENDNQELAFEYYNKCILLKDDNPYKSSAYSNLASCYLENNNLEDAEFCFNQANELDKTNNNYEGIYYNSFNLAKIYEMQHSPKTLEYLIAAKQSAEFIDEEYSILESTVALGDYYYDHKEMSQKALIEYFKALKVSRSYGDNFDISKIQQRIEDMRKRIDSDIFEKLEKQYAQ